MLDTITWGNPLNNHVPYLEANKSNFEKHINELVKFLPPKNSSKATREELNTIVDYLDDVSRDEKTLSRYLSYQGDAVLKPYAKLIGEKQLDGAVEIVDSLIDDIVPLVYKLKYFHQRPRPHQLAQYYKIKCFPYLQGTSPSYPSMGVLKARLISYVLGNNYPQYFEILEKIALDIEYSRQYLGLNFSSDIYYSIHIYETIVADADFKERYKI
jgi:hypothetical protein